MDALFLVLAALSILDLAASVVILAFARNFLNRAWHILDFAIRLAEQYSYDYNITRKEGTA